MRGSRRDWDAVVVGLGGIGSAALYWLARELRGDVLGVEQYDLGHERGASPESSRMLRIADHRPHRARLARRAYDAWDVVEEESRSSLITRLGGLDLFPEGAALPLDEVTEGLDAAASEYELLDARAIASRWPAFRLDPAVRGLYQANGGLVRTSLANAAHAGLAREHGAAIRERVAVDSVRSAAGEIDLRIDGVGYRCGRLVLCCGAWSNDLLGHLGVELPLTVTQEQVVSWQPADPAPLREGLLPIWCWKDDPSFHGFPYRQDAGLEVGQDAGGREVDARGRTFDPDPAALERVHSFLDRVLPAGAGDIRSVKTWLCTSTPDRELVIDSLRHEDERDERGEGCFVAVGAGHDFGLVSEIGRILAALALRDVAPEGVDLEPFRMNRDALRKEQD